MDKKESLGCDYITPTCNAIWATVSQQVICGSFTNESIGDEQDISDLFFD